MSDAATEATFCLRVMINKDKTKVLFAEADSDFVSVLLSFLALPLGRIVKVLEKHYGDKAPAFGSINSLYKGLSNLDAAFFSSKVAKLMLLNPPSSCDESLFSKLKLHVFKHPPTYFVCNKTEHGSSSACKCVCMYYGGVARCSCGQPMKVKAVKLGSEDAEVAFTIKAASFIISDDLKLVPNSVSFFQTLINTFGIAVADGAEISNLSLGTNEIMELLKCCLLSKTPLTDLVLNNGEISISSATNPDPGIFLHRIEKEETSTCKEIILKVMVHKSAKKVLFAEADDDFIEFLFSFLIIPLGGIECLLDKKTCLKSFDNLYRSISDGSLDKYFNTYTKNILLNPNIPYSSKPESTFLPLNYESAPKLQFCWDSNYTPPRFSIAGSPKYPLDKTENMLTFKSTVGEVNYVKQPTTYLVTDDLTVTPFHMSSAFSILNKLNISLSDVDELEVHIGLQEALSMLKASLTSNSALTNGLYNRLMRKQPKQEP